MNKTTNLAELKKTGSMRASAAGMGNVKKFFEAGKSSMLAVLPKHVSADRMLSLALGALRANPKLMECTTESLMSAVVVSSQLGLEPNTPLGHAYLIPFENRRAGRTDVQFIPGYRGLIDLARRSGQIVSIASHAVCANDDFEFEYGLDEKLQHKPSLAERGPIVGFYAVAKLKDGGHAFEVMSVEQVNAIRDKSQGYASAKRFNNTNHPWFTYYEEMGRKTVLRRLFKYLPISIEMANAVRLDEMSDAGQTQHLETALDVEFAVVDHEVPFDEPQDEERLIHEPQTVDPASKKQNQETSTVQDTQREKAQPAKVPVETILAAIADCKTITDLDACAEPIEAYDGRTKERKQLNEAHEAKRRQIRMATEGNGEPAPF